MASWQLAVCGLVVMVALSMGNPVGGGGAKCVIGGQEFNDGATFTLADVSGPCIKYKCTAGSYAPSEINCHNQADNTCHAVDTVVTENCVTKTCVHNNSVGFEITNQQCADKDGNCHNAGDTFTKTINGQDYDNCSCSFEGTTTNFACSG